MGSKNTDNQGTGQADGLSRLIAEVMSDCCNGEIGFTTAELSSRTGKGENACRIHIRQLIMDGRVTRGKPKMIETIDGVMKPRPTYIFKDKIKN